MVAGGLEVRCSFAREFPPKLNRKGSMNLQGQHFLLVVTLACRCR
jgi:hypothetical protein